MEENVEALGRRSERNKKSKETKIREEKVKKPKKTKKNKKRSILIFFIILNILAIGATYFMKKVEENGGGLSGALAAALGHNDKTLESLERLDVLIIGVSTDISAKLSDTLMVGSYDPKLQKASLISIPRDTFTGIYKSSATPNDKINAIYSLTEDPEKVLDAVNDILGMNIEKYVVVETDMLVEIVDEVGGIEFDVPINMNYTSVRQGLYINLNKGLQVLSGEQAEWLVRFRKNNDGTTYSSDYGAGDTGRMRTQREFIRAVGEQILVPSNITKIGSLLDIIANNFSTNINFASIKDYIPYTVDFDLSDLMTETIPGQDEYCNGTWIFIPNYDEIPEVVDYMFNFKDTGTLSSQIEEVKVEVVVCGEESSEALEIVSMLEEEGYSATIVLQSTQIYTTQIVKSKNVSYELAYHLRLMIGDESVEINDNESASHTENVIQIMLAD